MSSDKGGEQSPPSFRRPASLRACLQRAELDYALLGMVEKILARDDDVMAAMVRTDPAEYVLIADKLRALVARHRRVAKAATDAHEAIRAAFAGSRTL